MVRARVYKTEGVVLRHQDLGDADKIITVYCPYVGKLRVVGKGVLKPKSRLGGHVEPLSRVSLLIARGTNLDVISQVSPIDSFVGLRDDLERTAQGFYVAELLDLFTGEEDASPELYEAFLETLNALTVNRDGGLVLRRFELRLLSILGFAPELDSCVSCRESEFRGGVWFSPRSGGYVVLGVCGWRRVCVSDVSGCGGVVQVSEELGRVCDCGEGDAGAVGGRDGAGAQPVHTLSAGEGGEVGGVFGQVGSSASTEGLEFGSRVQKQSIHPESGRGRAILSAVPHPTFSRRNHV